jgi:hypothetical protein
MIDLLVLDAWMLVAADGWLALFACIAPLTSGAWRN